MDYALALKNQQANLDAKLLVAIRTAQAAANPPSDGCLVCGSPNSASPHFGSVSCLACAAFFRRTVALNITFNCKNNKACQIYYELRMICRACRYDKCLRAGMKRHCVQKRRPSKHKKEEEDEDPSSVVSPLAQYEMHMAAGGSAIVKDEPISPSMFTKREKMESASEEDIVTEKKESNQYEEYLPQPHSSSVDSYAEEDPTTIPSTSFANIFYAKQEPLLANPPFLNGLPNLSGLPGFVPFPLLTPDASANNSLMTTPPEEEDPSRPKTLYSNLMQESESMLYSGEGDFELKMSGKELLNYLLNLENEGMDRRRLNFSDDPIRAFTVGDGDIPYTRSSIKPHTVLQQIETVKFDNFLGFEYAKKMPLVQELNATEKAMFLRFCALGFAVIDIGYISSVVIEDGDEMLVFTDGTYSTCGPGDFSVGWDAEEKPEIKFELSTDHKKAYFLKFNIVFFNDIIVPMRKLKLDRVEHAFLKGICCWKLGLMEYTQKMKVIGRKIQSALMEGINEHYREIGREDGVTRLNDIFVIIGTLYESYVQVKEMYKQLDLFDLLKVDAITKSLLCV